MKELIKYVKNKNKSYSKSQVNFTDYCIGKLKRRGIDRDSVLKCLFKNGLYYAEIQNIPFKEKIEKRYKQVYKISSRYSLIVIVSYGESILNVINVIKTSKDLEKKWRKKI